MNRPGVVPAAIKTRRNDTHALAVGDLAGFRLRCRDENCNWYSFYSGLSTLALGRGHKAFGYVPDSATAVRVAEFALIPVYGKKQIESERPFTAQLNDDVWTVWGSLQCPDGKGGITDICVGGVARAQISRKDGRIRSVSHAK